MTRSIALLCGALAFMSSIALATIFGSVRGIIHDPQHRPIQGAMVMLKSKSSDWAKSASTDANGGFAFNAVPLGDNSISVASPGFSQAVQSLVVNSGTEPVVHFHLSLAGAKETVNVSGVPEILPTDSATPITLVNRLDIERTLGASRSNCVAMITNFVPGAYVTHDQLHIRGGHQTSWLVDGVPVPNTNITAGGVIDADNFKTSAHNFFDHGCIGSPFTCPDTAASPLVQTNSLSFNAGCRASRESDKLRRRRMPLLDPTSLFLTVLLRVASRELPSLRTAWSIPVGNPFTQAIGIGPPKLGPRPRGRVFG